MHTATHYTIFGLSKTPNISTSPAEVLCLPNPKVGNLRKTWESPGKQIPLPGLLERKKKTNCLQLLLAISTHMLNSRKSLAGLFQPPQRRPSQHLLNRRLMSLPFWGNSPDSIASHINKHIVTMGWNSGSQISAEIVNMIPNNSPKVLIQRHLLTTNQQITSLVGYLKAFDTHKTRGLRHSNAARGPAPLLTKLKIQEKGLKSQDLGVDGRC